jgi:hypothetical protein
MEMYALFMGSATTPCECAAGHHTIDPLVRGAAQAAPFMRWRDARLCDRIDVPSQQYARVRADRALLIPTHLRVCFLVSRIMMTKTTVTTIITKTTGSVVTTGEVDHFRRNCTKSKQSNWKQGGNNDKKPEDAKKDATVVEGDAMIVEEANACGIPFNDWIIDSGATEHMSVNF